MEAGKEPETLVNAEAKAKRPGRWKPGQSGNPRGMKTGSRHRATMLVENMYAGEAEAVTRKVIELAKAGDLVALKICADRLCAPIKSRPVSFKLPALRTVSDAVSAMTLIIDGAASGEILADEAQALSELVSTFIRTLEVNDLETRLAALEKARDEGRAATGSRYDA
jgi:hypothetical protein